MQKITPFLWFNGNVESALNFYVSIFANSKIVSVRRYGDEMPSKKGQIFTATFELEGQEFMALDGGPAFPFTEAISFFVKCETQEEVDKFWEKLSADGGSESMCGWLKDKFGVSWQIIPNALGEMLGDPDHVKSKKVMDAMLKMNKIDIAGLRKAYEE